MTGRALFLRRLLDGIETRDRLDAEIARLECPELPQARPARQARRAPPEIVVRVLNDAADQSPQRWLH